MLTLGSQSEVFLGAHKATRLQLASVPMLIWPQKCRCSISASVPVSEISTPSCPVLRGVIPVGSAEGALQRTPSRAACSADTVKKWQRKVPTLRYTVPEANGKVITGSQVLMDLADPSGKDTQVFLMKETALHCKTGLCDKSCSQNNELNVLSFENTAAVCVLGAARHWERLDLILVLLCFMSSGLPLSWFFVSVLIKYLVIQFKSTWRVFFCYSSGGSGGFVSSSMQ